MRSVTGEGPAVWCHGLKPDQHAFNGRGGSLFILWDHNPSGLGHFVSAPILRSLRTAYGFDVSPQAIFDAVLCLLSAASYSRRFSRDLEDSFPHIPFPKDAALFAECANVGAEIRAVETFSRNPNHRFTTARIVGKASSVILNVPPPSQAFLDAGDGTGFIVLQRDGSQRVAGVPREVWEFTISDFPVLYRWLAYRSERGDHYGQALDALLYRDLLDLIARIAEFLDLRTKADIILERTLESGALTLAGPRLDAPA
ncbi:MAG: hypothetical protein HY521_13745 [Proteobacteria bacterium]|nr:hypothetical protein [Pseudomonadota bacterium]